jgi:hypothetical protein
MIETMSYEIIYQYRVFKVSGREVGDQEPRYVLAAEMGSNNCYVGNKRSRSWDVMAVGTHDEVLRQTVRIASSCEGGMLKPGCKDCTPESLIGKVRRMLKKASLEESSVGWWSPWVRLTDEAMIEAARRLGGEVTEEKVYGRVESRALFDGNMNGYFSFVREHHRKLYGWQMCRVHGLPAS